MNFDRGVESLHYANKAILCRFVTAMRLPRSVLEITTRIKCILFSIKKALSLSVSSQLSRLSRFLNVLENWTRQYFITYSLRTWFILAISKQNWPLKWKNKSFYFCRLRPVDAIGSGLLSYDDICLTEECREKHLALPSATPKPLLEDSVGYLQS